MSAIDTTDEAAQQPKKKTEHELAQERVLDALSAVGGGRVADDDLVFEGTKIVLPRSMEGDPKQALKIIRDYMERDEQTTRFQRVYRFRPLDGAVALQKVLYKVFGTTGRNMPRMTMFGPQPPQMRSVSIGVNEQIQVPWGEIDFPTFKGSIYTSADQHKEYGVLFELIVDAPRRFRPHVEGLFKLVEEQLETESIYRGKAIDGQSEAEFVDLSGVSPEKVVYSEEVLEQLDANIWSLLKHTDAMREYGLPLKRAALLHGKYGTGKTLAAFLTAKIAVENNWTFIYCRPGRDDLHTTMQTARLYAPCVVFFEDVDTISDPTEESRDGVSTLLDLFDGIQAKGTELVAVMTTNHPERIHKGMVRPGRLDAVIEVGGLDAVGVGKLVRSVVPDRLLGTDLDFEAIHAAANGMETAFVKEGIDRAQRYAMSRNEGRPSVLETEDFVHAMRGLVPQLEMMNGAKEVVERDPLSTAVAKTVTGALTNSRIVREGAGTEVFARLHTGSEE